MAFGINPDMMNALDNPDNNSGDDANKGLENNGTDPNKGDENVDDKNKPDETEKPDSTDDQGKDVVDPEKKDENKDVIEPSEKKAGNLKKLKTYCKKDSLRLPKTRILQLLKIQK
jgi:hypothetical protein